MAKFEIYQRKNGEYQFNLRAGNGQVIFTSEGYTTLSNAKNGVESVRRNSSNPARFEKLQARDGRPYFAMKTTNGEVIGVSQMYSTATGRNKGIASVQRNAPIAEVVDLTKG